MTRRFVVVAVIAAAGLLAFWAVQRAQPQPPLLTSAYADLSAHFDQWVAYTGAAPGHILVGEWELAYGVDGRITYHRLVLYVRREDGYERYYRMQHPDGKIASALSRRMEPDLTPIGIRADRFFVGLNQVGLPRLEEHLGLTPPTRLRLNTQRTGEMGFGPDVGARLVRDGTITPAPPDFTVSGDSGLLYFSDDRAPSHLFIVP